ncbi:Ubiquitin family [Popillia japonica]|uniref:Ubiquitin family n=1 Tax=Popillia japonica TaxID=7064 RepID=A0AAW1IZH9_POPJA
MTSPHVYLGIRLAQNDYKRIEMENADLDMKVDLFKEEITKRIGVAKHQIELIYCGIILEDDKSLSSCGVKHGVTLHVLKKTIPREPIPPRPVTEADIQELVLAFRAFMISPIYRTALQRLSRPEVLETIKAATPGLADDPVAIAIIQDPELIVQLSDLDTVKRIATHHPSLIEAANHIAAHVHEETASVNNSRAGTSTGYSYSLEALSDDDDDEMESTPNEPPREGHPLTRNTSYGTITAAQLADAILSSTQNLNFGVGTSALSTPQAAQGGTNAQPTTPSSSGNVITNEMFLNAIQHAFSTTPAATLGSPAANDSFNATNNAPESMETLRTRLQSQLRQMRELGLTNESLNLRALQITSGDVQGAVELVFNGAIE